MSVDDLINGVFKDRGGFIDGANLYALVGSIITGEAFVLNLQDFLFENFTHFLRGEDPKAVLVGAYHTENDTRQAIKIVREEGHHGGGLVYAPGWQVLLGNIHKNLLYTMPLQEYYIGAAAFFQHQVDAGIITIGMFDRVEAAEDMIDYIRHFIKDEEGNIL